MVVVSAQCDVSAALPQGKRHGAHRSGGCVGRKASLPGCGKCRPRRDSIPGTFSPIASRYIGCAITVHHQHKLVFNKKLNKIMYIAIAFI